LAIAGILVVGAVLRFSTLDVQSYWSDEAATVRLLRIERRKPGAMRLPGFRIAGAGFEPATFGL